MPDYHKSAMEYVQDYKTSDSEMQAKLLDFLTSEEDLAVVEALIKHIIDLESWIQDAKEVLKRG